MTTVERYGIIIHGALKPLFPEQNFNGPCCIKVPDWVNYKHGNYYTYFADHRGKFIRIAYANEVSSDWKILDKKILESDHSLHDTDCYDHVASPDIWIDENKRKFLLFFHGKSREKGGEQWTYVAESIDGIEFDLLHNYPIAPFYFRTFAYNNVFFGLVKGGDLWFSNKIDSRYTPSHNIFTGNKISDIWHNKAGSVRHLCVALWENKLYVFYSKIGDKPERIYLSHIDITNKKMHEWVVESTKEIIRPEHSWEGATLPLIESSPGASDLPENALRDPYCLVDNNRLWLFYTIMGERAIALCEINEMID